MSKKTFVCLANSDRNLGRCVAGILVEKISDKWSVIKDSTGSPSWVRPVSKTGEGEIPITCVKDFNLLDVLEVDIQEPCPINHQSENCYFDLTSLKKVDAISNNSILLEQMLDIKHKLVFDSLEKTVLPDQPIDYSLMLIKPDQVKNIYWETSPWLPLKKSLKADFVYNSTEYKYINVKDPVINEIYKRTPSYYSLEEYDFYLTLSLANEYQHEQQGTKKKYKLIAGIIPVLKK